MMMIIMVCIMSSLFLSLPAAKTPFALLLLIIAISLSMSAMFSISMSSWYAFLMFMIYVGGMLVMFAYFTASTPNQQNMSSKYLMFTLVMNMFVTLLIFMPSKNLPLLAIHYNQLTSMFSDQNMSALVIITLILLMTMVIIVTMTKHSKGPMRTFM